MFINLWKVAGELQRPKNITVTAKMRVLLWLAATKFDRSLLGIVGLMREEARHTARRRREEESEMNRFESTRAE